MKCQTCEKKYKAEAKYDGKTKIGPWAYMCEPCFSSYGIGLGLGKGHKIKSVVEGVGVEYEKSF